MLSNMKKFSRNKRGILICSCFLKLYFFFEIEFLKEQVGSTNSNFTNLSSCFMVISTPSQVAVTLYRFPENSD